MSFVVRLRVIHLSPLGNSRRSPSPLKTGVRRRGRPRRRRHRLRPHHHRPRLPPPALGFVLVTSPSTSALFDRVDRGDFNAAIVANPGASASLAASLTGTARSPYAPSSAVTFAFDEGRSGSTMTTLLRAQISALVAAASSGVATATLASLRSGNLTLSVVDSAALLSPVGYTENNLHPVQFAGLQTFLGVSYLDSWVIELFVINVMLSVVWTPLEGKVRRDHLLLYVALHITATSAALAFWPQVIVRGLGATVVTARIFFASWAWVWFCMTIFGGILAVVIIALGPSVGNLFSFIFLILNLVSSTGILPQELMPPFFKIGLALPMYQGPAGGRTIVLGSYNRLGENLGVLFAWLGLLLIALGYSAWRAREAVAAEVKRSASVGAALLLAPEEGGGDRDGKNRASSFSVVPARERPGGGKGPAARVSSTSAAGAGAGGANSAGAGLAPDAGGDSASGAERDLEAGLGDQGVGAAAAAGSSPAGAQQQKQQQAATVSAVAGAGAARNGAPAQGRGGAAGAEPGTRLSM